jgi:isoleucyl-tRNA synthetase
VLDKKGNKMSKRYGNAVDPYQIIEQYGSDPLRWYMMTNASPWDNLKFDEDGVDEVSRKFFGTLYNTYSFFALYANVDGFMYCEPEIPVSERPEIDRWIISLLNSLIQEVDGYYSDYEPTKAGRAVSDFVIEHLSNWYVRLNRKRYWGGSYDKDKIAAFQALYTCLEVISRLMAPIAPFYADKLFTDLNGVTKLIKAESVHLADFPKPDPSLIDKELESRMQLAQRLSSMVLALRRKVGIKVRQPLSTMMVPVQDDVQKARIDAVSSLILSEVNVKELKFVESTAGLLIKRIKPDYKKLGPKCGKLMKEVANRLTSLPQDAINQFEQDGYIELDFMGQSIRIELTDVEIISEDIPGWLVAHEGSLTVALDVDVTEELRLEGLARELVNRVQNLRKSSGLEITDKILITISPEDSIRAAVERFREYIMGQTLAQSIQVADFQEKGTEVDVNGLLLRLKIQKA